MDLTAGQRKAVFGLIVVVLAGLGVYMFVPAARGSGSSGASHSPARHSPAAAASPPAARTSSPAPVVAAPSAPDIYQWLPFTQAQLASAAATATRFCDAYGTWSYTENAAGYAATMRDLVTPGLSQFLQQSYSTSGVAELRTSRKQVSVGRSVIDSLRTFGPSSITFVVEISQEITGTSGQSPVTAQYAVTVTGVGNAWQANDIELASAGNS